MFDDYLAKTMELGQMRVEQSGVDIDQETADFYFERLMVSLLMGCLCMIASRLN